MGFLDNYLTVNQKVKLAHDKYPNHRLITEIVDMDLAAGWVLFKASFYKDSECQDPTFTDFAYGHVNFYPNNMKRWFIEDTSTSVCGRVLATALGLDEKPNRETMEQIERTKSKDINADDQGVWGIKASNQESMPTVATVVAELEQSLGSEVVAESPICEHGHMIFRTGEKAGREWGGWFCVEKTKSKQCAAVWAVRSATTGNWRINNG